MQKYNKENSNKKNYFRQYDNYNSKNCFYEKKIIIYLIIIALLSSYFSLFFIHNINLKDNKKDKELSKIEYPKNDKDDDNKQNNNTIDNNTTNNVKNSDEVDSILNNNITSDGNNNNIINSTINSIISGTTISNNSGNSHTSNSNEDIVNNEDRFKIVQESKESKESKEWKELKSLNIFNNYYFNGNSIIAPNVHGKYNFTVENYKDYKILYNLKFIENNEYKINMVYKLKLNGLYIAGDEQTYVKYVDLNTNDIVINEHTKDIYTLEWKWLDSDNDTQIGKTQEANYKMSIEVNASELDN